MSSPIEWYESAQKWSVAFQAKDADIRALAESYLQKAILPPVPNLSEQKLEEWSEIYLYKNISEVQRHLDNREDGPHLCLQFTALCEWITRQEKIFSVQENADFARRLAAMLDRITYLFSENLFPFRGTPQSLQIVSQLSEPARSVFPFEETYQVLTLDSSGQIELLALPENPNFPERARTYTAPEHSAQHLLEEIAEYFSGFSFAGFPQEQEEELSVGYWQLDLTDIYGQSWRFAGPLRQHAEERLSFFSRRMRELANTRSLFVFDGLWQSEAPIRRLTLEYKCSGSEHSPAGRREEAIVLDADAGTLEWFRRTERSGEFWHRYRIPSEITRLLDGFSNTDLFRLPAPPAVDFVLPREEIPHYTLSVLFQSRIYQVLQGAYDKTELPGWFPFLTGAIRALLEHLHSGSMLDLDSCLKTHRRQGQLIYCGVSFKDSWKNYYYRTEDDTLQTGDMVIVPAGKENHQKLARIESVDCYFPDEVPFPMEKTKAILRRARPQDLQDMV